MIAPDMATMLGFIFTDAAVEAPFLHAALEDSALPASRIRLEITETALINNMTAAARVVADMRSAGCTVALDDFGSGLSSFSYLKQFPVDYLKIDGSFIRNLARNAVDREIVSSINDIGHRLGVRTVAEWVEDEGTLHTLRANVDYAEAEAHTAYGVCGVKVWIFKGEILGHDPLAQDRLMMEAQTSGVRPARDDRRN